MTSSKQGHIIIRLSAAGDLVLASHFMVALKKKYPQEPIIFITLPQYQSIAEHFNVEGVWTPQSIHISSLQRQLSWVIWDLQSTSSKKWIVQKTIHSLKNLLNIHKIQKIQYQFPNLIWHRLRFRWTPQKFQPSPIQPLSIGGIRQQQRHQLNIQDNEWPDKKDLFIPTLFQSPPPVEKPYIVWSVGASQNLKTLSTEAWLVWMRRWFSQENQPIYALGWTLEERFLIDSVRQFFPKIHYNPETQTFTDWIRFIAHASLVWAMDSVNGHLGAALGVPTLVWMGPTSDVQGYWSDPPDWVRFAALDLNCRPCSRMGQKVCYYQNHLCFHPNYQSDIFEKHYTWMRGHFYA